MAFASNGILCNKNVYFKMLWPTSGGKIDKAVIIIAFLLYEMTVEHQIIDRLSVIEPIESNQIKYIGQIQQHFWAPQNHVKCYSKEHGNQRLEGNR